MAKVSRHSPPLSLWAMIHAGLTSRYGALLPSGLDITARLLIVLINYSANLIRATKTNTLSRK